MRRAVTFVAAAALQIACSPPLRSNIPAQPAAGDSGAAPPAEPPVGPPLPESHPPFYDYEIKTPACVAGAPVPEPASPVQSCADIKLDPLPEPQTIVALDWNGTCWWSTTDGLGDLLVTSLDENGAAEWETWSPGGALLSDSLGGHHQVASGLPGGGFAYLYMGWQNRYVEGVGFMSPSQDGVQYTHFAFPGRDAGFAYSPIPEGGYAVALQGYDGSRPGGPVGLWGSTIDRPGHLTAFTATAFYPTWERNDPSNYYGFTPLSLGIAIGVDGAGRILVVWEGGKTCGPGTIAARWFAPNGSPLTEVFVAAVGAGWLPSVLARLPDGSLALKDEAGEWQLRFADGVAGAEPAPAWLAARPGTRLRLARGGRAVALYPANQPVPASPAAWVEVLTPAGESCGVTDFPAADWSGWGWWTPLDTFDIGTDGTIVQTVSDLPTGSCTAPSGDVLGCCLYRYWPRALGAGALP